MHAGAQWPVGNIYNHHSDWGDAWGRGPWSLHWLGRSDEANCLHQWTLTVCAVVAWCPQLCGGVSPAASTSLPYYPKNWQFRALFYMLLFKCSSIPRFSPFDLPAIMNLSLCLKCPCITVTLFFLLHSVILLFKHWYAKKLNWNQIPGKLKSVTVTRVTADISNWNSSSDISNPFVNSQSY